MTSDGEARIAENLDRLLHERPPPHLRDTLRLPLIPGPWNPATAGIAAPSLAHKPITPREWAVDGLVPLRAVTLLSGDGGAGKSTLALQLSCAITLGRRWMGHETRPGKVAYVSCEDDEAELHRRLVAIANAEEWGLADLDGLELFDRVGHDNAIMAQARRPGEWVDTEWWERFSDWACTEFGPGLIVLDSLYDFFPGNQLDMVCARQFMAKLSRLAHAANCAIIVLWHPSKSGMESGDGTSGNVAFRNAARCMLYLERDKESGIDAPLILKTKKGNYGPPAEDIRIRWDEGRFVPIQPDIPASGLFGAMERRNVDRAFLDALTAALDEGLEPSFSRDARDLWAPRLLKRTRSEVRTFTERELMAAMDSCLRDGTAVVGKTPGPPTKQKKIVVPKGHAYAIKSNPADGC